MKIEVRDIAVSFGKKEILRGVTTVFPEGKFTGIIGPNGSGKSTLLKCMYRVLSPQRGVLYLDGRPLSSYSVKESAQKQDVLAQHHSYSFDFAVLDVVLMGRSPYKKIMDRDTKEDYELAYGALETVGLAEFAKRNFSELSGGEQQRVMLARALVQQTECLLLDEPTNHLDIQYQIQLLRTVKKQGLTVIAAIHDLNLAAMYCDYLIAVKDGRIAAAGTPREVLTTERIRSLFQVEAAILERGDGSVVVVYEA